MKVLFTPEVNTETKQKFESLPDLEIQYVTRNTLTKEAVEDAEVILGNIPVSFYPFCKAVKWIQLDSAGADHVKGIDHEFLLTNASGAYGTAISEHMLGCVLMVQKNLIHYLEQQKSHEWINLGSVETIGNSTVLCIGMGDIGTEFAKRMKFLGAHVIGIRRTQKEKPDCYDEAYTMDQLDDVLPKADIIAMSLPNTPETVHIMNDHTLSLTKKGSILINVGRGSAINESALMRIQKNEHFAGICLDVTEHEPMPKNNALWNMKNVYITPHIAGRFNAAVTYDKVLDILYTNLCHYVNNEPLEHIVDQTQGY